MVRPPDAWQQPKLADRWRPGVWLGKTLIGDMQMVGTLAGVVCSRDVREVEAQDDDHALFEGMRWTPWNPRRSVEILDPHIRVPSKDQRIVDKSLTAPQRASFDEFIKEMGKTLWCRGCKYAGPEAVHSKRCMECRQKYEQNKRRRIEQQHQ